jgi:hypothetical protein
MDKRFCTVDKRFLHFFEEISLGCRVKKISKRGVLRMIEKGGVENDRKKSFE